MIEKNLDWILLILSIVVCFFDWLLFGTFISLIGNILAYSGILIFIIKKFPTFKEYLNFQFLFYNILFDLIIKDFSNDNIKHRKNKK